MVRWFFHAFVLLAVAGSNFSSEILLAGQKKKDNPDAVRAYVLALRFQNRKEYGLAAEKWEAFTGSYKEDPRLPDAYHNWGVCLLQQKKYAEAGRKFRIVVTKYKPEAFESIDASQFNLALSLYYLSQQTKKNELLLEAAKEFGKVPSQFEKSNQAPVALYYQGECLYQAGQKKEALAAYQKLKNAYKGSDLVPDALYSLGTVQQELNQHKEAAETFEYFLDKYEENDLADECTLRLGQALFDQGKYREAEKKFARVSNKGEKFPFADFAWMQRAQCFYELKDKNRAADLFEEFPRRFRESPRKGEAYLSAGKCRYLLGGDSNLNRARELLSKANNKKYPEAPEAAYWLGQTYLRLNNASEALEVVEEALENYKESDLLPQLRFVKISALAEDPKHQTKAPELFAKFKQENPTHELAPRALYLASLGYLQQGKADKAIQYSEEFLNHQKIGKDKLRPEVLFIAGEANLLLEKDNFTKAQQWFKELISKYSDHEFAPQSQLRVGLCLFLADKNKESIAYLEKAQQKLEKSEQKAEAFFLIGRNLQKQGDHKAAIQAFENSRNTKGDWKRGDEVLLAMAVSLQKENRPQDAIGQLNNLNNQYSRSDLRDQAYFQLGEMYYDAKKYEEAKENYLRVINDFKDSDLKGLAQYGIGLSEFAKNDFAEAIEAFTKQLDKYPNETKKTRVLYMRGLAFQRTKKFKEAVSDLQAFLKTDPKKKDKLNTLFALGMCQVESKQFKQAVETFDNLLKEDYPQKDRVLYEKGFALLEVPDKNAAAESFNRLANNYPNSRLAPESCFREGEILESSKKLDEAIVAYNRGREIAAKILPDQKDPKKSQKLKDLQGKLKYKLGWVHYQQKNYEDASAFLIDQVKNHADSDSKLINAGGYLAGECLFKMKKYKEAIPYFDIPIKNQSKKYLVRAYYRNGECLNEIENFQKSEEYFGKIVTKYNDFDLINDAKFGLGKARQYQGKLDQAIEIYDTITKDPKSKNTELAARSRWMVGQCYFSKNPKVAIKHFLEAAEGYEYPEWKAQGYFSTARCYYQLKNFKKAAEYYKLVASKFPNHEKGKTATSLLNDPEVFPQKQSRVVIPAPFLQPRNLNLVRRRQ